MWWVMSYIILYVLYIYYNRLYPHRLTWWVFPCLQPTPAGWQWNCGLCQTAWRGFLQSPICIPARRFLTQLRYTSTIHTAKPKPTYLRMIAQIHLLTSHSLAAHLKSLSVTRPCFPMRVKVPLNHSKTCDSSSSKSCCLSSCSAGVVEVLSWQSASAGDCSSVLLTRTSVGVSHSRLSLDILRFSFASLPMVILALWPPVPLSTCEGSDVFSSKQSGRLTVSTVTTLACGISMFFCLSHAMA